MITVRTSNTRGTTNLEWLDSNHSFSFGSFQDPTHNGFGPLRVINDDRVAPGAGFGEHPHRDMEILSFVIDGAMEHRDSTGTRGTVNAGDIQRMTAGRGIRHSEMNASQSDPIRFLQIWIEPESPGLEPGYEQIAAPRAQRTDRLALVASRDGRDGALTVHQDTDIYLGAPTPGTTLAHTLAPERAAWVQVINGSVTLNGTQLNSGDGAAIQDEPTLELTGASDDADLILFDLAL